MYSLKQAFSMAMQFRTCPPPEVFNDPVHEDPIKKHISFCSHCSDPDYQDEKVWETLIKPLIKPLDMQDQDISPGQIRSIKNEYAGWSDGLYINAPLVLVLNTEAHLRVAQIYHDTAMASPGDFILTDTILGDIFVETWNTYFVRSHFLSPPIARISDKTLEQIFDMMKNPEYIPDEEITPWKILNEQDPRRVFKELEKDVGNFFVSRFYTDSLKYDSVEEIMSDIHRWIPDAYIEPYPKTIAETLAFVRTERLAAQSEDTDTAPVNVFVINDEKIKGFTSVKAEIFIKEIVSGKTGIGGRITGLPEEIRSSILMAYLFIEDEGLKSPDSVNWDKHEKHFFIEFNTEKSGKLSLAILCE